MDVIKIIDGENGENGENEKEIFEQERACTYRIMRTTSFHYYYVNPEYHIKMHFLKNVSIPRVFKKMQMKRMIFERDISFGDENASIEKLEYTIIVPFQKRNIHLSLFDSDIVHMYSANDGIISLSQDGHVYINHIDTGEYIFMTRLPKIEKIEAYHQYDEVLEERRDVLLFHLYQKEKVMIEWVK